MGALSALSVLSRQDAMGSLSVKGRNGWGWVSFLKRRRDQVALLRPCAARSNIFKIRDF
jgi:hypothetical protein